MGPFLLLIFALCAEWNSFEVAASGSDISYEDIRKANFSCYPYDTCAAARIQVYEGTRTSSGLLNRYYLCRCDRLCSKLGTCCIDSPYRNVPLSTVTPSCRSVDYTNHGLYIVDKCEVRGNFNPTWKIRCERGPWGGEDMRMIAPVTSLFTSLTYKNYYCLKCHETTNEFLYWEVKMSLFAFEDKIPNSKVVYDPDKKEWMGRDADGKSFRVRMGFEVPESIRSLVISCDTMMISNCSDSWGDENVRNLCGSYTAVVYTKNINSRQVYKNVHCALCNFEAKENLECDILSGVAGQEYPTPFHCVFNLNIRGKGGECGGKGLKLHWNNKGNKIRVNECIVPGYVIKDEKCAPP